MACRYGFTRVRGIAMHMERSLHFLLYAVKVVRGEGICIEKQRFSQLFPCLWWLTVEHPLSLAYFSVGSPYSEGSLPVQG